MTPGAMQAAAYGSAVAPPVYRSLKVVRPAGALHGGGGGGQYRAAAACGGVPQAQQQFRSANAGATGVFGAASYGQDHLAFQQNKFQQQGAQRGGYMPAAAAASSSSSSSALKKALGQAAQQQPQLLSHAPPLPLVFQRSAKHCVVAGTSLAGVCAHLLAVAKAQGATLKKDPTEEATLKMHKVAPPTAPDGGCSAVVFKVRVFTLDAGQRRYLLDFTHRKGSRVVACELYRSVVARLRRANCIRTPAYDHLLEEGGAAKKCKVYTVPSFRRAQAGGLGAGPAAVEPAVAAATVAPLLAAAASPCFDQQLASCQLLAKLTASKRAAREAAARGAGAGAGAMAGAMDVDGGEVDDDSNEYMAAALVRAMFDDAAEGAVVALLGCLADRKDDARQPAAQAQRAPPPRVHEDVRRCIISTVANMALQQRDGGDALRALLIKARALEPIRRALPDGGDEVHKGTYSSEQAKFALFYVVNGYAKL